MMALFCATSWAQSHRLFLADGTPAPDYAARIASLKAGDEITFSDDKTFIVDKVLGKGAHTVVVSLRGLDGKPTGRALRLAKYYGRHPVRRGETYQNLLSGFVPTQQRLEARGAQVVKVYAEESRPAEYVTVEALHFEFLYRDFLNQSGPAKSLSAAERASITREFVQFGVSLWGFRTIADQNSEQIGYVKGRGWVLFDFNPETSVATRIHEGSPFMPDYAMVMAGHHAVMNGEMMGGGDERLPFPKDAQARRDILAGIEARRRAEGLAESACTLLLRSIGRFFRR